MGFFNNRFSSFTGGQQNDQQNGQQEYAPRTGPSNGSTMMKMLKGNLGIGASQERPGKLCLPNCTLDNSEHCAGCVKEQESILAALEELDELQKAVEDANSSPSAPAMSKPVKCSLCGASIEKGNQACPYCDTPYPPEALVPEIPKSKREQKQLLLQKSAQTYKTYSDWHASSLNRQTKTLTGVLGGFVQMVSSFSGGATKMDEAQIEQGAQHYSVSYSDYILGVINGKYMTPNSMQLLKLGEAMAVQSRQQNTGASMAPAQPQQVVQSQPKQTKHMTSLDFIAKHNETWGAPQYSAGGGGGGGSSICCGNCRHYMAADNKCAVRPAYAQPKNASDRCQDYHSN